MVRIVTPEGGMGTYTKVLNDDGVQMQGVTGIDISIRPGDVVTATISARVQCDEINAQLLLDMDTLKRSADALGYDLVAKSQG